MTLAGVGRHYGFAAGELLAMTWPELAFWAACAGAWQRAMRPEGA